MNPGWATVEFLPRKVPKTSFYRQLQLGRGLLAGIRLPPHSEGAKLHEAVIERLQNRPDYKPPNLPRAYEVVKTRIAPAGR